MILNRLVADGGNDDELVSSFKKTSAAVRSDEEVVLAFCTAIQNEKEAEATARNFIKGSFSGPLVEAYGSLGAETLKRRIKTAEGWEKSHEGNASVSLCLGRLYEASEEREKAKQAYEKSIEGGNTTGASQQLANLLAFDGDFEKSNEYLRIALTE